MLLHVGELQQSTMLLIQQMAIQMNSACRLPSLHVWARKQECSCHPAPATLPLVHATQAPAATAGAAVHGALPADTPMTCDCWLQMVHLGLC